MNNAVEQGVLWSLSAYLQMVLLAGGLEGSQALEDELLQAVCPVSLAPTKL